jgi:TonB family protein
MLERWVGFVLLLWAFAPNLPSQDTTGPLPTNPSALLDLARQKNGLSGPGVRPWHIHGTYRTYDEKGSLLREGVYEEWWLSPTKYKRTFSSTDFTQTDYANGIGLFRSGAQDWPEGFEIALRERLINPLPPASLLTDIDLKKSERSAGRGKLQCVSMTYPTNPHIKVPSDFFPSACFDSTAPILRESITGRTQIIYSNFLTFQGHNLARQLEITTCGTTAAELVLDQVEMIADPSEAIVAPSTDAKSIGLTNLTFKASRTLYPVVIKKVVPAPNSKTGHVQGKVKVNATIGEDGHVRTVRVLDGPFDLCQPAQEAAKQWEFWPPEIMGQPRSFEIEIVFIQMLG